MSIQRGVRAWVFGASVLAAASAAGADDLKNDSFTIQYDAQGLRSLKRTNDVHDAMWFRLMAVR